MTAITEPTTVDAHEDAEAVGIDRPGLHGDAGRPAHNEAFQDVMLRNIARRSFLMGAAASVPVLMAASAFGVTRARAEAPATGGGLSFKPIAPSKEDRVVVPEGYEHQVLIRWGDPLFPDSPEFDPKNLTAEAQRRQFGFNNDFLGYFPLKGEGRALLVVNHEYTRGAEMFEGYKTGQSRAHAEVEMAAHGGSVIELVRKDGAWSVDRTSKYNRRITAETSMTITGPAAGHALMKTKDDPDGRTVLGMLNNCSGGKTPWGTWLTCEENINYYFGQNAKAADEAVKAAHSRYGVAKELSVAGWEPFFDRFDVSKEPNEAFRFGWVVEIDPYDPDFTPRKRTALGRAKHEAATCAIARDGRVAVYTGDDQQFDYVYKFVSAQKYDPGDRRKNFDLLDTGVLYVAKFEDDGSGRWLELSMKNPVLADKFSSDGEILIKTRLAADAVGATAMDRPEDCQPSPVTGKVYLTMTNNSKRAKAGAEKGADAANPRGPNIGGHIIELSEEGGDHGATAFTWDIFLLAGDPNVELKVAAADLKPGLSPNATFFAGYADAQKLGKIAWPDNIAFDKAGNLWLATDGQATSDAIGNPNDALHVVPAEGPERGYLRQFLSGPKGCEICGPEFSDDGLSLFCAVQHPGEEGGFPNAISTWPDGTTLPRPAVVAVRRVDGGPIGS